MEDACRILVSLSPRARSTSAVYAPAPLLYWLPTHLALFRWFSWSFSLFSFLWHVNFAFSVAQGINSAEAGVLYLCMLPKQKFLSTHVPSESWSLTSWINASTTVLLFKAVTSAVISLTSWCVAIVLQFMLSPALSVHVRSVQPGVLQKWGRTALHQILRVVKCRFKGWCERRILF